MVHVKNDNEMLVISSREFRANQKNYLDKIDEGVEILIQRSKNKSYKIVPVGDEDIVMNKGKFLDKLNLSLEQIKEGKFTSLETKEDITNFLTAL